MILGMEAEDQSDINMSGGDNRVKSDKIIAEQGEVICNEPDYAVLGPDML